MGYPNYRSDLVQALIIETLSVSFACHVEHVHNRTKNWFSSTCGCLHLSMCLVIIYIITWQSIVLR